MKLAALLVRVINAILDAINRKKKADAANNVADTVANGGRVRESERSYSELAEQSRSDKPE